LPGLANASTILGTKEEDMPMTVASIPQNFMNSLRETFLALSLLKSSSLAIEHLLMFR
jgi:hypothetical protein